jgi:hypothetical protein
MLWKSGYVESLSSKESLLITEQIGMGNSRESESSVDVVGFQ